MTDEPIETELHDDEHEVDLQPIAPDDAIAELNEVCEERDALRVRVAELEEEHHQAASELDRHGAPPATALYARVRALAALNVRKLEEVVEQARVEIDAMRASTFRKLPLERQAVTKKIRIGADHKLYITVGLYEDGKLGEIFLKMEKQGSMLSGMMDAFAISCSLALKQGVPLEKLCSKFQNLRFEPSGMTGIEEMPFVTSPIDAAFKWIALRFLPKEPPSTP